MAVRNQCWPDHYRRFQFILQSWGGAGEGKGGEDSGQSADQPGYKPGWGWGWDPPGGTPPPPPLRTPLPEGWRGG